MGACAQYLHTEEPDIRGVEVQYITAETARSGRADIFYLSYRNIDLEIGGPSML